MASVSLADGDIAIVCIDCDLIGLAREAIHGGPLSPLGIARGRRRLRVQRRKRKAAAATLARF
jgi:hypothetical protein